MTLVEKWTEVAEPTIVARVAQGRALVELRMVDKATARVRDLAEATPPNLEAMLVLGEAHLLRGWQREARRVAERGLELWPGHAGFRSLLERCADAPPPPEDESVDLDHLPPAELVRLARHHMASGSFVRARSLLERVRRRVPDHRAAQDLLWALDGDYALPGPTLTELCDRWGPELPFLPEIADEPEHTESTRLLDVDPLEERRSNHAFPALFRNLGETDPDDAGTESEHTAVSGMAPTVELRTFEPSEHTDPGSDDTQIVRVLMNHPRGAEPPAAPSGAPNLAAELRPPPSLRPARDYAAGDDEDDALIVHTRREESTDATDRRDLGGLTEELEIEKKATQKGAVEDANWAATQPPNARVQSAAPNQPHRRVDAAAQAAAARDARPAGGKGGSPTPIPAGRAVRPPNPPAGMSVWVLVLAGVFGLAAVMFAFLAVLVAVGR